jgi:DNA excision repair protein ERCC-2
VAKSVESLFKEIGLTPRPGQAEAAETLAQYIDQNKRVLFSAPTGWGKTHTILAALMKTENFPILWLVRSLTLGTRIREDADRWGLYTFVAAGREKVCPIAQKLRGAIHDFCRFFRHKCPYARLPSPPLPTITSWEELVARGTSEGWCPYYAQDLVDADIIVQNYWRRRRPVRVVVLDEAHNLLLPQEIEYSVGQLAEAIHIAKEYCSEKLMRRLEEILHHILYTSVGEVKPLVSEEEQWELRRIYFEALEKGDILKPLLDLIRASVVYVEAEKVFLYRPPLNLHVRPMIYTSATLPSEATLFLNAEVELRVPWTQKARALVIEGLSTQFSKYDVKMAERYKRLLVKVGKQCRRVLVFAASERVARDLRPWVHYEECQLPESWEGIALFRARGRFSEGVNLSSDCVVLAGAPFLPPEVTSSLARVLRRTGHPNPMRAAIDLPMLITSLQSIGRAWRDPQRPPVVFLADERYTRYTGELEEYLELSTVSLDKL